MYGKLVNGQLEYADTKILIDGERTITNPRAEDYRESGYKEIVVNQPEDDDKEYVEEYEEQEDKIIVNYKEA